jgi:hypothetical protein
MLLANAINHRSIDDIDRNWYTLFLRATHNYALSPHSNAHAASTELWLIYKLFGDLSVPSLTTLRWEALSNFPEAILITARKAPLRDDLATVFLHNLPRLMNNDVPKQIDFLQRLLAIVPNHRGALWVLGGMLREAPGREKEGMEMMRRAASLGVEHIFPVSAQELEAIQ